MSNVCCKELGAWCHAFTRAERALAAGEAALLGLLVAGLVLLVLHLVACKHPHADAPTITDETPPDQQENPEREDKAYEEPWAETPSLDYDHLVVEPSDGEDAGDEYARFFLALVKPKARGEYAFGCILSVISEHWALTAASCVQAIEEVDSLDSFVMVRGYGGRQGRPLGVADLRVHPRWAGPDEVRSAHDAAALRAEASLLTGSGAALRLPSMMDYFLLAIGERLIALGYGEYRMSDGGRKGPERRGLQRATVVSAGPQVCDGSWALRHLAPRGPVAAGSCGARGLCAGPLWRRGEACSHCAGTPLLRPGAPPLLLGLMGATPQCGLDCEPRSYVNVARLRDWIRTLQ